MQENRDPQTRREAAGLVSRDAREQHGLELLSRDSMSTILAEPSLP